MSGPAPADDDLSARLTDAALRCVARWGAAKTSFDDVAREAGVSRATAYRAFPGGRERLLREATRREVVRFYDGLDRELARADTLEDLLTRGVVHALLAISDHPVLRTLIDTEPERVLPHFAFHRLDRILAATTELARPHLLRFVDEADVVPTAEWAARLVITYGVHPTPAVDPHEPETVRHVVRTFVLPALSPC